MAKIEKMDREQLLYIIAQEFGDNKEGWEQLAVEMVNAMSDTQAKEILGYIAKNWDIDTMGYEASARKSIAKDFSYGEYMAIEDEWNKFKEKHGGDGSADMALQFIDEECSDIYDEEECDMIFNYIGILEENDANKSTNKSKGEKMNSKIRYANIQKRLAKLGGFTKEDEDEDDHDGKVEVEVEVENEGDDDESPETVTDEIEEACKECKSQKAVRTSKKRMKMAKGEDMPADADDFQNDNQKGSGNAGSELPEEANDQQDINEKGSGNAGKELPEDADDQQDIKESANKKRIKMRKFSVTPGGSPDQKSYNQGYQQSPMVRDAIDGHIGSKTEKFNEVDMMNERINDLMKSRRNPVSNNGVPKRIR